MQFATIVKDNRECAAFSQAGGFVRVGEVVPGPEPEGSRSLFELICHPGLGDLERTLTMAEARPGTAFQDLSFAPLYRYPRKIWGIGLNYREHAADLGAMIHPQPGSFMKPCTSVIGPGEAIRLPASSNRVTVEAELGVVIGKACRNVSAQEALEYVAGYTCILDMTAEDILKQNPRYLTRAKSFDTFFSFGPVLLTPDEIADLANLEIRTVVNGRVRARNQVRNMVFSPPEIVSFHSEVMTLEPGDIFSTGTPGAYPVQAGDVACCEIDGFPSLENPVEKSVKR